MTNAREEIAVLGQRRGVPARTVTGGVITSAGMLAATFAAVP